MSIRFFEIKDGRGVTDCTGKGLDEYKIGTNGCKCCRYFVSRNLEERWVECASMNSTNRNGANSED